MPSSSLLLTTTDSSRWQAESRYGEHCGHCTGRHWLLCLCVYVRLSVCKTDSSTAEHGLSLRMKRYCCTVFVLFDTARKWWLYSLCICFSFSFSTQLAVAVVEVVGARRSLKTRFTWVTLRFQAPHSYCRGAWIGSGSGTGASCSSIISFISSSENSKIGSIINHCRTHRSRTLYLQTKQASLGSQSETRCNAVHGDRQTVELLH